MKLVRQLWYILPPQERMEGAFLLCAMVLGAFFEAMSIGLVIPFIAVLKEPDLLFKAEPLRPLLSNLNISDPRDLYRWLFRYSLYRDPEVLVIDEGTAHLGPSSLSDLAGLGRMFALIPPF